jgi:hypothetical protein
MTRFGHCRTSGKCARLRTIERETSATGSPLKIFLRFRRIVSKIAQNAVGERHEQPVRTQCLTSAALCLCPQPNSLSLFSPIPKLASAARSPTRQLALTLSKQLVDTQTLNIRASNAAKVLGLPWLTDGCVSYTLCSRRAVQPRSVPGETGMSRKDAQRTS